MVVPGKTEGHFTIISDFATSLGNSLLCQCSVFSTSISVGSSSVSPFSTRLLLELLVECLKCLKFRSKLMDLILSIGTNLTPVLDEPVLFVVVALENLHFVEFVAVFRGVSETKVNINFFSCLIQDMSFSNELRDWVDLGNSSSEWWRGCSLLNWYNVLSWCSSWSCYWANEFCDMFASSSNFESRASAWSKCGDILWSWTSCCSSRCSGASLELSWSVSWSFFDLLSSSHCISWLNCCFV